MKLRMMCTSVSTDLDGSLLKCDFQPVHGDGATPEEDTNSSWGAVGAPAGLLRLHVETAKASILVGTVYEMELVEVSKVL